MDPVKQFKDNQQKLSKQAKINFINNTYHPDVLDYHIPKSIYKFNEYDNSDFVDYVYETLKKGVENNKYIHLNIPPDKITVTGYAPLKLYTYYPSLRSQYPIGHSAIQYRPIGINKGMKDEDYNLLTNNCSDATGQCLEKIFGKKMNTVLFTTPGDVRDFAIENGGIQKPNLPFVSIPMNESRYNKYLEFLREYYPKLKDRPILNPTMASDITPKNNKPESH